MKLLAALFALLWLVGCGGSAGGGSTVAGLTDAQRGVVLDSVLAKFSQIRAGGGTVDAQNEAMAAAMAAMPEFEAAGASPEFDCAWGRFADGRLVIVGNHPFPAGSLAPSRSPGGRATFIAKETKARLGHMFGPDFPQLQNPIKDMERFLQVDGSYQIQSPPEGKLRLSDYRAVSGDGFVYFNSHGGEGKTKAGTSVFVMVSSTPHEPATDALPEVKADWDANRLSYYVGSAGTVNGVETYGKWYAITHQFIRDHMSFGENAIVFLNVCYTANPDLEIQRFRDAFFAKNAGAVVGWTQLCQSASAFDAAKYFVDRLVAKNEFLKENPEQRAFSTVQVLQDMVSEGKATDGNSELKAFYKTGVNNVGLRPTIKYMIRDELNDYLVLHGEFGSETGVVKVNDVPATLVGGWSSSVLITRIPESGNGSDGPVWVEVNGKKSKERFLTSWRGTFTYNFQDSQPNSTLHEESTVNFHIRMDVDDYRETAGGAILENDPKVFYATGAATLAWTCGGGITDQQGTFLSWERSLTLPQYVRENVLIPASKWTVVGAYNPTTRMMIINIQNGGPKLVHRRGEPDTEEMGPGGTYTKSLNADWSGPPHDLSSGDTTAKFSALAVTWPPPNATRRP